MDASELPEDAPNGSLALVEGEPIPEAYTVSSVDELPSDAVDGSMALCTAENGAVETWVLNDALTVEPLETGRSYEALITYNNTNYTHIGWGSYGPDGVYALNIQDPMYNLYAQPFIFNPSGGYGIPHGWAEGTPKEITISEMGEELRGWFEVNGKMTLTETKYKTSLYTHENGEWVYKCEVA
jgi:hypothetical protein